MHSAADQGFFWYLYFVRRSAGAYFRFGENTHHRPTHWWTQPKPWTPPLQARRGNLSRLAPYTIDRAYGFLRSAELLHAGARGTAPCARRLWELRRALEDDPRFVRLQTEPDYGGGDAGMPLMLDEPETVGGSSKFPPCQAGLPEL